MRILLPFSPTQYNFTCHYLSISTIKHKQQFNWKLLNNLISLIVHKKCQTSNCIFSLFFTGATTHLLSVQNVLRSFISRVLFSDQLFISSGLEVLKLLVWFRSANTNGQMVLSPVVTAYHMYVWVFHHCNHPIWCLEDRYNSQKMFPHVH
jgi:hypothetical protein